jgi:threonine dehydratase
VPVSLDDILRARDAIQSTVRNTPVKRSGSLSARTGGDVWLKLENFQRTGSFKVRGATWKIRNLTDDERKAGVVAASAGNHAQGVAYAATAAGVASHVFMPQDATLAKVAATKSYGATVHLHGRDYQDAYEAAVAFQQEKGLAFVHAYDDPFIMAGQGTLGVEVHEAIEDLDTVLVPIGGGGLIAGVATALKALRPNIRVVGVQAEGASSVAPSLQKGRVVPLDEVQTMADGIACRTLGSQTFAVIQRHVDEVVTVSEAEIAEAILFLLERAKTTAEGAGAVSLAAVIGGHVDVEGEKACCVVSGGNIDMNLLGRIIQQGLVKADRIMAFETTVPDRPGAIVALLDLLARNRANVLDVDHDRYRLGVPLHRVAVDIHLETRGADHATQLIAAMRGAGYDVRVVGADHRPA